MNEADRDARSLPPALAGGLKSQRKSEGESVIHPLTRIVLTSIAEIKLHESANEIRH